jgi:tRNA pseudouridine32 synthase/23S rRNA pseudouridine746 synthase
MSTRARRARSAVTRVTRAEHFRGVSLLQVAIATGRTHQIRVHAASGIGVPLLGDPVYGDGKGARRTLLHAAALEVPREGKPPILAMAPLPADFAALGFADNG